MSYNPNQKIQAPFGDIYSIGSPYLDKLSDRLYQEDRQKKQQEVKSAKMLDDEFAKNMAGIRDADIPDLTKAYGDWKLANQVLMKKGNATPEEQLAVLKKKADMYNVLSKSKAQREAEKAQGTDVMKNPNGYIEGAHGELIKIMNTPVSKIGDLDVFEPLKFKGNVTNFTPLLKAAAGTPKDMEDEIVVNPNGLQKEVTKVKRVNNANEYFDALRSGIIGSKGSSNFIRTFGNISPESYKLTEDQYNQMMADPVMAKRFGNPKPLPPTEDLTDTEKVAKYMAMQHALVNHPITQVGKVEPDWKGRKDYEFAHQLNMLKKREAGKLQRLKILTDYNIDDVHGMVVDSNNTRTVHWPNAGDETYVDITDLTDAQKEDLLGKATAEQQRRGQKYKHEPILLDGNRMYVGKKESGDIYGKDNETIDPDQVLVNTFTRTGKLKKPLGKGELKIKDIKEKVVEEKPIPTLNASEYKKKRKG